MRSGTSGFSSTMACGSGRGTSGTCTRPRPSLLRPELAVPEPELRTDTERPLDGPDSRPDTERRDWDDPEDIRELAREPWLPEPREPPPGAEIPVAGDATGPCRPRPDGAGTTGARPQRPQYSSPPPTSS
ncbi:hypothetical protein SNOD_12175 [Streptomyces nodosus]|uniref:Uncharacterized protein n=1 Tax=Streptomyces nodosus TaxID=40318 RepID=A0A0B5DBT4_9ACTN|nr:hypothetical protein SNOD_12175 [Streptomyces nodosus]